MILSQKHVFVIINLDWTIKRVGIPIYCMVLGRKDFLGDNPHMHNQKCDFLPIHIY
jgi:hypothetical protein